FMWPMVITSGPEWRVITVATSALQSQYNNNWTLVMAGTTLAMLPLVLLMIAFQKQIIRSVGETILRCTVAPGAERGPQSRRRALQCCCYRPAYPQLRRARCWSCASDGHRGHRPLRSRGFKRA